MNDRAKTDQHYRLLAENVSDVIWTLDMSLLLTYASPSVLRLRGYSAEETMVHTLEEILTPDSFDLAMKIFREEMARENDPDSDPDRSVTIELEMSRKDGATVWTENKMSFLRDQDGRPVGILGVTRDIAERRQAEKALREAHDELERRVEKRTSELALKNLQLQRDIAERKRTEEALRESEQRYRTLFESAPAGIGMASRDGEVLACNDAMLHITGYSEDEIKKTNLADIYQNPEDRALLLKRLKAEGSVKDYEVILKRKDGTHYNACLSMKPTYLHGKDVFLTICVDITDRKRAEEELRESRKRFHTLAEAAFEGIVIHEKGEILEVNKAFAMLFGYGQSECIGMSVLDFVAPDSLDMGKEALRSADGKTYKVTVKKKDGTLFPVDAVGRAISYEGRQARVVAIRDVTEQKKAEEEKERLRFQLHQADKMTTVGQLAAGIAHEINNPIAFVLPNIQELKKQCLLQQELAKLYENGAPAYEIYEFRRANEMDSAMAYLPRMLSDSLEGIERIRDITRELLQFSRTDDAAEQVDLSELLDSSLAVAANEIRYRAGIVKRYGDIPLVSVHRGMMNQVFLNIIVNAAQSIEEGREEENWIRVATGQEGDRVFVEISNSGEPIPPDVLPKVFDPFFSTKAQGTGLGLSISYSIVQQHGGHIEVTSGNDEGTVFRVWLPVDTGLKTRSAADTRVKEEKKRRGRVLVIDDERAILDVMPMMLEPLHTMVAAQSGQEALEILAQDKNFDVVLCDLLMPGMTGVELYNRVEKEYPDLAGRFVFLTGGVFTPRTTEFVKRVDNRKLSKPVDLRELLQTIDDTIRG